jgi:hypothetical protein
MRPARPALAAAFALALTATVTTSFIRGYLSTPTVDGAHGHAAPVPALSRRLVVIVFDGLRADIALRPGVMPTLDRLAAAGAQGIAMTTPVSMTAIGVQALGTGASPSPIDIARNFNPEALKGENLLSVLRASGHRVAFVGDRTWGSLYGAAGDTLLAIDAVDIRDTEDCDRRTLAAAESALAGSTYDVVIAHFNGIDHTGHLYRSDSPQYLDKVRRSDAIVAALSRPELLRGGTLYVTSDHGSGPNGNHGDAGDPLSRQTPFVLYGAGVVPGTRGLDLSQLDVAPTLALLLGVARPAPAEGTPLVEALAFSPAQRAAALVDALSQRETYLGEILRGGAPATSRQSLDLAERDLGSGDLLGASLTAREGLTTAEAAFQQSLTAQPLSAWLVIAVTLLGVLLLLRLAASSMMDSPLGREPTALIGGASLAVAGSALAQAVAPVAADPVCGLAVVLVTLAVLRLEPRPNLARLTLALATLGSVALVLAALYADPFGFFAGAGHALKLPTAGAVVMGGGLLVAWFRRRLWAFARQADEAAILVPLGFVSLCHPQVALVAAVLAAGVLIAFVAIRRRGRWPAASLGGLCAIGCGLYVDGWRYTGYAEHTFRLPGPAILRGPIGGTSLAAALLVMVLARLVPPRALRTRAVALVMPLAVAALAFALLTSSGLPGSERGVNLALVAAAAVVVAGLASKPARLLGLTAGTLAALLALAHGADRVCLPAFVLLALWIFPAAVRATADAPPMARLALVGVLVVLLRLAIYGFTFGQFGFEAIDLTTSVAGQGAQHSALLPVALMVARFFLPFVTLLAIGREALPRSERTALAPIVAGVLLLRVACLLLLYRFYLGQLVAYVLVPELFFYLLFIASLWVAAAFPLAVSTPADALVGLDSPAADESAMPSTPSRSSSPSPSEHSAINASASARMRATSVGSIRLVPPPPVAGSSGSSGTSGS